MPGDTASLPGMVFTVPGPGRPLVADVGQAATGSAASTVLDLPARLGQPSRQLFFDTFFDDFSLSCVPRYRRYEPDESSDDSGVPEGQDRRQAPRFIELSWRPAPLLDSARAAVPDQPDSGMDTLSLPTVQPALGDPPPRPAAAFSNESFNPGALSLRLSPPDVSSPLEEPIDEEAVLLSPRYVGANVTELISNTDPLRDTLVRIDSLDTAAAPAPAPRDRFAELRAPGAREASRPAVPVLLVGQAALGVLSGPSPSSATREHVEGGLIVSSFSTEIALMDALDDQVDDLSVDPPAQETAQLAPSLSYVGYVIDRQRMSGDGTFVDDRRIVVSGAERSDYIDTAVAYGRVYRYRIAAVVRWVHRSDLPVDRLSTDVQQQSAPTPLGSMVLRYMRSSWTGYVHSVVLDTDLPPPPVGLRVVPVSRRGQVMVSWIVPDAPQGDVARFTLLRRVRRAGVFSTHWEVLADDLPFSNGLFIDTAAHDPEAELVYAMTSTSIHGQTSLLSEQVGCRLVRSGDEAEATLVSFPGVEASAHGSFSVLPASIDGREVVCRSSVSVCARVGQSRHVNDSTETVLRLQSVETGESLDIPVSFSFRNFVEPVSLGLSRERGSSRDLVTPAADVDSSPAQQPATSFGV